MLYKFRMKRFCGLRSALLIIIAGLSKLKNNIVLNSFQHGYQQKTGTYLQVINIPPQAQPEGGVACKPPSNPPRAKPEGEIACKPPKLNEPLRAMLSFTHSGGGLYIFFDFRVFPLVPRLTHCIERVPYFEEALPFPFVGTFWSCGADTELFRR